MSTILNSLDFTDLLKAYLNSNVQLPDATDLAGHEFCGDRWRLKFSSGGERWEQTVDLEDLLVWLWTQNLKASPGISV
ncbi:hypothetical protein HNP46_000255 [Pseudomonas nitritireducens]|uniref:Uncharacterized protein n=1 Tax=Pseudomonas nitroreducens TaxID=46680 RepID=A0A7W7KFM0_PSENT|nr:hypothetical protein [Pseudomonas nitritireducens]MBB4861444.1 hypothetical protein [Pseudomonas nitritireducens]